MTDALRGWRRKSAVLAGIFGIAPVLGFSAWSLSERIHAPRVRSMELTETVQVDVPPRIRSMRLWIPRLSEDEFQSAELLAIDAPSPHKAVQDPDFSNPLLYLEVEAPRPGTVGVRLKYRVTRKEQTCLPDRQVHPEGSGEAAPNLFKNPRGLVVINDEVRQIAREATRGLKDPLAKARALYDYVLGHVKYDTTGSGWGRGDVVYACRVGKGNCTDFHSLFIALAQAEGIPARFKIGYPLPEASEGPVVKPYHCWAEFHVAGKGWIPVDISEAWKHPVKADYYFGALDENRVLVSTGREIRLPLQKGPALNYMVRPYAEADGKPLSSVWVRREYRNLRKWFDKLTIKGETKT